MSQQFSEFVYHKDENDGKCRVLGRDSKSWFRITAFYVVYYTLLGFLITFSIKGYDKIALKPPGGIPSKITTRLDQPGSSVIPLNQIRDTYDGINSIKFWNKANTSANNLYVETFASYLEKAEKLNQHTNSKDCSNLEEISEKTVCQVKNADSSIIDRKVIEQSILDENPIFALSLNKIINWCPKNSKLDYILEENGWPHGFVHNAVYTHCYETDAAGQAIKDSNFAVKPFANSREFEILPGYYPYKGSDKYGEDHPNYESDYLPWNKPFLLMQINKIDKEKDSWTISDENSEKTPNYFSCYWDAQNIDRPFKPETWESNPLAKEWSADLEKIGVGIVKFSVSYAKEDQEKYSAGIAGL